MTQPLSPESARLADWLAHYATCFIDDERVGRRMLEIVAVLRAPAQPTDMREALQECADILALVEHPRHEDPQYGAEVAALGDRIGYGALMSSASASWRKRLGEDGDPVGGEFVAGPCQATVTRALRMVRDALSVTSTVQQHGGP